MRAARKKVVILSENVQDVCWRETIEFLHDVTFKGIMIWDMNQAPLTLSGNYRVDGDKLDLVTQPNNLTPTKWIIKFNSDNEVTITFRDGGVQKRDGTSGSYCKVV